MTDAVHKHGALAGIELWHGGACTLNRTSRIAPLSPSGMPWLSTHLGFMGNLRPRAMDAGDIRDLLGWQADGARRAMRAGFDIVYVYGAHHAPRYWESPESFDPERFTNANNKLRTPFTHLPFGGGPRGCIGGNYAMLQILMILNALLKRYDFQLTPGQTIEARPMVILRPKHGIRMTFTSASPK